MGKLFNPPRLSRIPICVIPHGCERRWHSAVRRQPCQKPKSRSENILRLWFYQSEISISRSLLFFFFLNKQTHVSETCSSRNSSSISYAPQDAIFVDEGFYWACFALISPHQIPQQYTARPRNGLILLPYQREGISLLASNIEEHRANIGPIAEHCRHYNQSLHGPTAHVFVGSIARLLLRSAITSVWILNTKVTLGVLEQPSGYKFPLVIVAVYVRVSLRMLLLNIHFPPLAPGYYIVPVLSCSLPLEKIRSFTCMCAKKASVDLSNTRPIKLRLLPSFTKARTAVPSFSGTWLPTVSNSFCPARCPRESAQNPRL
ncbi:hypothetical protein MPH_00659 [Macrophomina phaseolina MS6]|uniref:Uncharacterized protein n=1 Tax=Macrophomina phaseolina (strain MS6) TaxID=1126212 RepID=K2S5C6_MACPH|nr:hypothetical protein MPH_00659 [Macrophomina phaseolina MS6]